MPYNSLPALVGDNHALGAALRHVNFGRDRDDVLSKSDPVPRGRPVTGTPENSNRFRPPFMDERGDTIRVTAPGTSSRRHQRSRFLASSSIITLIDSGETLDSPRSKVIFCSLPVKANGTW